MGFNPKKYEEKWRKKWLKEKIYEPDLKRAKKPYYNLMMFPYPSAEGLHIGSVRTFSGIDIYGRLKRMQGYDVFEPIGLDGFGIHSENYALKVGKHPIEHAKDSEKNFYRQLGMIGNSFAWEERLETYDPNYYKWTQWIFIQMFKHGLAYRKKAAVNWCPSCKTVLADEQVLHGECERCQSKVEKKDLEQWFFKITDYADRLLKNLDKIDWPEPIKIAQRNWIGKSEGALIKFQIPNSRFQMEVFTTRPDTLFGATYMVLGPEHQLVKNLESRIQNLGEVREYIKKAKAKTDEERIAEGKEKTGVELKGIKAINPANEEEIPVWVADYVLGNVGTGAIMAVPAHDERDYEFAKKFNLPISDAPLVDKDEIVKKVGGRKTINYRLRDWLISRQRYWGPPIPIVYCRKCWEITNHKTQNPNKTQNPKPQVQNLRAGIDYAVFDGEKFMIHPVLEKDLPVRLPRIKNYRPTGTGVAPLASEPSFYKVKCPKCKSWVRRETDVSDTFLDSAWYYLRYPSVKDKKQPWNSAITKKWFPVDMYIGGAEHAVLHLLYVRFVALALQDMNVLHFSARGGSASGGEEPFKTFRTHGLITKDGAKMSKSRGNVVNPDEYISAYGSDAIRMYLAFLAPLTHGGDFRDSGVTGITRFLNRVWNLGNYKLQITNYKQNPNSKLQTILHKTVKKVTEDIESFQYNTAISALMILLNEFEKNPDAVGKKELEVFLKLLAPLAPHLTEELWQQSHTISYKLKAKSFRSIHLEPWPKYDPKLIQEETFELVIQVNGKVRGKTTMPMGTQEEEAKRVALEDKTIRQYVTGEPRKVIFVPNKLINFVV